MSLAVWREAVIIALVLAVLAEYRVLACGLAVWLSTIQPIAHPINQPTNWRVVVTVFGWIDV